MTLFALAPEDKLKFRSSLVWAAIIVGIFYAVWVVAIGLNTAVWIAFGHTQRVMGPLMSVVFLLSPFALTWLSVRLLKGRVPFQVAYPENGVGGMTLGLAAVAWFSMSALGGLEYLKYNPRGAFGFASFILAVTTAAMLIGAVCAILFVKKDRSVLMILVSPVVAIASFVIAATLLH